MQGNLTSLPAVGFQHIFTIHTQGFLKRHNTSVYSAIFFNTAWLLVAVKQPGTCWWL